MTDDELKQLIASNAKAIEALSSSLTQERQERQGHLAEWEKDRNQLYQYLSRIVAAQSSFYEVQADYYHQLSILGERQTQISERQTQMQAQMLQILRHMNLPTEPGFRISYLSS
jgi:septal ring factor EnvC (AmiA/AmiB activator)